ncbi:MAG: diguanylate cyclase [Gammaproteobacteria bacterium]|jgi:diguanylate cyclase (GGDEF)-like protein|nr:diguanylate cyclase [Gammaproteobacteria bacterium]
MNRRQRERFGPPRKSAAGGHWRQRLRADFRLAIISLFGVSVMAGILPLAAYRFYVGDWLTGTGDLVLVAVFAALVAYAWSSGRAGRAARLIAVTMTGGYLALVIFGSISVMWAFPILGAGFLLADRVFASLSAVGTLAITALFADRFDAAVDIWSFLITGLLVSVFGLIFATRTEIQQRQLSEIASRDPLTRAGNRRALRYALDEAAALKVRYDSPTSLILLDLDHFKSINDVHGHEAGDQVLVSLAELVTSRLRGQDSLFRLGGEEFVVLLAGTHAGEAERLAGIIRRTLSTQLDGPGGSVTASMGVAELAPSEPVREWLARADEALYEAKRSGRDRVVTARPPDA